MLFPHGHLAREENIGTRDERHLIRLTAIAAAAALLLFAGLGRADLFNPDEPREAEMGREMWASGDFLVPRLNGQPFVEKPPLNYWLLSASYAVAGGPSEAAARLPPALAGFLTVVLTYLFGRRLVGGPAATIGAIVLLTAFQFFWLARRSLMDMPLTLLLFLTCICLHRGATAERRRAAWLLGGYAAAAAAVLLKGVVGIAIPAVALVAWLAARRDWRGVTRLWLVPGMIAALVPTAIWTWLVVRQLGPAAAREIVWVNNVLRFTGGAVGKGHEQPFWYYAPTLFVEFAPWSVVLPFALAAAWVALRRAAPPPPERDALAFLGAWFAAPLLVLSLSSTKRGIYLVPLYPAAALLIGWWLSRASAPRAGEPSAAASGAGEVPARRPGVAAGLLLGMALLLGAVFLAALMTARPLEWVAPSVALALLLPLGVAAYRAARARRLPATALRCAAFVGAAYLGAALFVVPPIVARAASARSTGAALRALLDQGDRLAIYGFRQGVMGGPLFYAGSTLPILRTPEDLARHLAPGGAAAPRALALIREDDLDAAAPRAGVPLVVARRFAREVPPRFRERRRTLVLVAAGERDAS